MNGKLKVEIISVEDVSANIYLMPNSFSDSYGTHGILENNKMYINVESGTYTIPSDWSLWVVYNPGIFDGGINMKSWLEMLTQDDVSKIDSEWQPTGISLA